LNMKSALAGVTTVALSSGFAYYLLNQDQSIMGSMSDVELRFVEHITYHGHTYTTKEEYEYRLDLFKKADDSIAALNAENSSFTVGHNKFSTMTQFEKEQYLGRKGVSSSANAVQDEVKGIELPTSLDWRTKGAVNAVKDQGQCGSCWTFSGVTVIESAHFIKTGTLLSLSEQQIVDCDSHLGCQGGMEDNVLKYAETHQMCTEAEYPYEAKSHLMRCNDSVCDTGVEVQTYHHVTANSATAMKEALQSNPITVAVDANCDAFMYYTSGILTKSCGTGLDHAIAAVGYGVENGQEYWIIRNSWSTSWGE